MAETLYDRLKAVSDLQRGPALRRDVNAFKQLDEGLAESDIYTAIQKKLSEEATARRQSIADANARNYLSLLTKGQKRDSLLSDVNTSEQGAINASINSAITTGADTAQRQNSQTAVQNFIGQLTGTAPKKTSFLDNLLRVGSGMGQTPGVSFASDFIRSSQRDQAAQAAAEQARANRDLKEADLAAKRAASVERAKLELRRVQALEGTRADTQQRFEKGTLKPDQISAAVRQSLGRQPELKDQLDGLIGLGDQAVAEVGIVYDELRKADKTGKDQDTLVREAVARVINIKAATDPVVNTGIGPNTTINIGKGATRP